MPLAYSHYTLTFVETPPAVAMGSVRYRALREGLNQLLGEKAGQWIKIEIAANKESGRSTESISTGFRNAAYAWAKAVGIDKTKKVITRKVTADDGSFAVYMGLLTKE